MLPSVGHHPRKIAIGITLCRQLCHPSPKQTKCTGDSSRIQALQRRGSIPRRCRDPKLRASAQEPVEVELEDRKQVCRRNLHASLLQVALQCLPVLLLQRAQALQRVFIISGSSSGGRGRSILCSRAAEHRQMGVFHSRAGHRPSDHVCGETSG